MSLLKVVEWPAKVLETKSSDVTVFDDKLRTFVADMHETMDHSKGIGLAANQVNSLQRVLTMMIPWHDADEDESGREEKKWWHDKRFTFINPVITKKSGKMKYMEGCLSFPEIYDYVDRAANITVKAVDEHGKEFEVDADGLFSVCLQHEIDHIDGIVFINRMSRLKNKVIRQKLQKRQLLAKSSEPEE